ncbi:hypothetical protein HDC92_001007 [Pedobacter sp. AK017]|nr:hypothetical protein [Pedobacter sp. AK017]
MIRTDTGLNPEKHPLYLHSGILKITLDEHTRIDIGSNSLSMQYQLLWEKLKPANDLVAKYKKDLLTARQSQSSDTLTILTNISEARKKSFNIPTEFIKNHPSSDVSLEALKMMAKGNPQISSASERYNELFLLFNSLDREVRETSGGTMYLEFLKKFKNEL